MQKILSLTIVLLLIILSINAETISLNKAKEIALKSNPGLSAQKESLKSSEWNYNNSIISLFPSGSLSASYRQSDQEFSSFGSTYSESGSYGVNLSQPLFMGGKLINAALIAKTSRDISKITLTDKELEILNTTETKYFSLIEAMNLLEIATDQLTIADQRVQDSQTRFAQGTISKAELLQVQADAADKKVSLIQAQLSYDVSYKDLKNYLLLSDDFEIDVEIDDSFESEISELNMIDSVNMDTLVDRIVTFSNSNSNTMKMLELSTSISKTNVNMAVGNFMPTLNLSYSYTNSGDAREDWSEYPWSSTLSVSASLPIFPLVDSYSDVQKAKADYRKAEYDFIDSKNGNALGVESSLLSLLSSARKYEASKLSLEYSEETFKQMQARYNNGLLSSTDLLDAEVMYKSSRMNAVSSKFDYLKAKSTLKKQLGLSDDSRLISMILEK